MYFDRQFADYPTPDTYEADEVCWQLNGALPFANQTYHDDRVLRSSWDGENLVMELDPGCWFSAKGKVANGLSITFVGAQILHQEKWFDGSVIWWLYHELTLIDGGYEVDIKGELVWHDGGRTPQVDRAASLTVRAADIWLSIDGEVLPPETGQLPVGDLICALSWNAPKARQQEAKAHIAQQANFPYIMLILPLAQKDCWGNCAEVLCGLDDEALRPLMPSMMQWLIDLSWPGARTVRDRFIQAQVEVLKPALESAVQSACERQDDLWLANLSELLEHPFLVDVLDRDTLSILLGQKHA